jgi:hypothetical protein
VTVYRPTEGDDAVSWSAVSGLTGFKLDLMPVTDEVTRQVFGNEANIETMALDHTRTILKRDGIVVTAGTHTGTRFRVASALVFHKFTQLGLVSTSEPIQPDEEPEFPSVALQQVGGAWVVVTDNDEEPDGYFVESGGKLVIDTAAESGLPIALDGALLVGS